MEKSFFSIKLASFLMFMLAAGLWSCSEDSMQIQDEAPVGYMTLNINVGNTATRVANGAGEDHYNENLIKSVDLFFFPANASDDTPAVKAAHFSFTGNAVPTGTVQLTVKISEEDISKLFTSDTKKCTVYAVVNCDATKNLNTPTSITKATLDATAVGTTEVGDNKGFNLYGPQADFVMRGTSDDVEYTASNNTVTGKIEVKRVAAKIRIAVHIDGVIYQDATDGTIQQRKEEETEEEFEQRMTKGIADGTITKWTAQLTNMHAHITHGVNNARLDGNFLSDESTAYYQSNVTANKLGRRLLDPAGTQIPEYETGKPEGLPASPTYTYDDGRTVEFKYYNWLPFYTYPNQWKNTIDEERQTYLTVMVPWSSGSGTTTNYEPTYYQVPISRDNGAIMSNQYYRIFLNIGIIGSFTVAEPVELEASYDIEEWGQEEMGVDIKTYRYLVVNQTNWEMNNSESITIPFYTSHEVVVKSVEISFDHFNDNTDGTGTIVTHTIKDTPTAASGYAYTSGSVNSQTYTRSNQYFYTYEIKNNQLTFTHSLDLWTPMGSNSSEVKTSTGTISYFTRDTQYQAYYPTTITVTLVHKDRIGQPDESAFTETVVFVQYPGMYIQASHNPGNNPGVTSGNWWNPTTTYPDFSKGYVSVNNRGPDGNVQFGSLGNMNGGNTNPNMYVISVTLLDASNNYEIGDPRTLDYNISLSNNSFTNPSNVNNNANNPHTRWTNNPPADAPSMYPTDKGNNNRTLCFYYPTDETTTVESANKFGTENMIAPKFRIASSWGTTTTMTRENARKRCATYQELGRPAGRWRLPTKAEFAFIIGLSSMGRIPALFTHKTGAQGSNQGYWTAHGAYTFADKSTTLEQVTTTNANNQVAYARCVYDEWYWIKDDGSEDLCDVGTFTWGDKLKANPQQTKERLRRAMQK